MSCFSLVSVVPWLCLHRGMNQGSLSLQIALVQSNHARLCCSWRSSSPSSSPSTTATFSSLPLAVAQGKHGLTEPRGGTVVLGSAITAAHPCCQVSFCILREHLSCSYPGPDLTHCPWGLSDRPAVATDFPSCVCWTCSRSCPGRLSQSCCTWTTTHLASYPALQSWNSLQSPSQGLQAKQWLLCKELLVWPIWRQELPSKAFTPQRGSLLSAAGKD